jgi:hypothetical protein
VGKVSVLVSVLVLFNGCAALRIGSMDDRDGDASSVTSDPDEARIITSDIDNFWHAYDTATPENDFLVYREEYLRRGSVGLREFTRLKIRNIRYFVLRVWRHSRYYASVRKSTLEIRSKESEIRSTYHKMKDLYPEAVFPPVYFLIGAMNTGGISTKSGLIIGAELFGKTSSSPLEELNPWEKSVVQSVDRIPQAVAHELVHSQQRYPKEAVNLLERSIAEGSADFLSEIIAGSHIHELQHMYGDQHEEELWKEFKTAMSGKDLSRWLYNGGILVAKGEPVERPADLGYYVGYKICQAFYEKSADKKRAIKDILEIRDFDEFFKESGYGTTVAAGN